MKKRVKLSLICSFCFSVLFASLFSGCGKEETAEQAKMGAVTVTEITPNSAVITASVEHGGGVNVTSRGLVWGTSENPTLENNGGRTTSGNGTGEFVITITGLSPATKYFVRAWATNSEGTAYSSQLEFTTAGGTALVTTSEITEIASGSAVSGGEVTDDGGIAITSRGVVWGTAEEPGIDENEGFTEDGDGLGEFASELTGLSPATTYYVRAYATNDEGTVYGNQVEFTTLPGEATVITAEVTGITESSAISGGEASDDGGIEITSRGVVWSTAEEPGIDENEGFTEDGDGLGEFASELTGLSPATTYYVRAYATNDEGTVYGNQIEFTTLAGMATILTSEVADITDNTAVAGGNVESDGGAQVTDRGVVWSATPDPSLENNQGIMAGGSGTGDFSVGIKGLSARTTYYVRAYATNSQGTAYGDEVEFATIDFPGISTHSAYEITDNSAMLRGNVTDDGGGAITGRGAVWSTSGEPTVDLNDGMTNQGTGAGQFTTAIGGLYAGTTYFVRAWAENNAGVSYGEVLELETYDGRLSDIDNNVYYYVVIGEQEWMVSNLKTTRLDDGTSLRHETDNLVWASLWEKEVPAYSWYENYGEKFKDVFGALYNFYAVETEKLCPSGWRVPTTGDLVKLINFLGDMETAGGKLKGTAYWEDPNSGATDEVRFNALPGGVRYPYEGDFPGQFDGLNKTGVWWTSTTYEIGAYTYGMSYFWEQIFANDSKKESGVSVRCMRGDPPASPPHYIHLP